RICAHAFVSGIRRRLLPPRWAPPWPRRRPTPPSPTPTRQPLWRPRCRPVSRRWPFEPDMGQSDPQARFLSHGPGFGLVLVMLFAVMAGGYEEEAGARREWLLRAVAGSPSEGVNHESRPGCPPWWYNDGAVGPVATGRPAEVLRPGFACLSPAALFFR